MTWLLAVLAGGRSLRMGRDKAELRWDGEPILERLKRRLAPPRLPMWVCARPGQVLSLPSDARRVDDVDGSEGPLAGLAALSRIHPSDPVLVVPCDMPDLPQETGFIFAAALGGADGVVLESGSGSEPFPCLLAPSALAAAREAYAAGRRRADAWTAGLRVVRLDPAIAFPDASPRAFLNANEPRDLR